MTNLTLAEALATNRLDAFVSQAESEGIGPIDRSQFETLVGAVTAPRPEDQTSRSLARGSKRGK